MSVKLGMNAKLYRNTGTYDDPTWTEIGNARDVTLSLEKGEADVTTRANNGWRATVGTLKDATVDFQMVWDSDDTNFTALRSAFLGNTAIEMAVMDGDIDDGDSEGFRASMDVMSFTRNEALEEAITADVSLKPTYSANAPEWIGDGEGSEAS